MKRNPSFDLVAPRYLFQEVAHRVDLFMRENPNAQLIRLGIGDTTQALCPIISKALIDESKALSSPETYVGYGPEQGIEPLRKMIAQRFYPHLSADEVFISDGAKCDIARLQVLFGSDAKIAIQDPSYPAYGDSCRLMGKNPILVPCQKDLGFFFDLKDLEPCNVFFCCSPNNPTGTVFTYKQVQDLVAHAKKFGYIIVFDAAYSSYIQGNLPCSIYEVTGAEEVAIEIGSFSKMAGMSGVRLGWTVVPHKLLYSNQKQVHADWLRLIGTLFNGASILSQKAGIAALTDEGQQQIDSQIHAYLRNTHKLKNALLRAGFSVFGGDHAPYIWAQSERFSSSWQAFDYFLNHYRIITTPGIGFGPAGEGYVRISGFAQDANIIEACERLAHSQ